MFAAQKHVLCVLIGGRIDRIVAFHFFVTELHAIGFKCLHLRYYYSLILCDMLNSQMPESMSYIQPELMWGDYRGI